MYIMAIAVYGATGFTGKLVTAELASRNIDVKLLGRNQDALESLGYPKAKVHAVDLNNVTELAQALAGCSTVISCVGPYTQYGEPVLKAAIEAKCNYVDLSGEQEWVKRVYNDYGPAAAQAGVTLLPAATDDGVGSDIIASLITRDSSNVKSLKVHHGYFDAVMTRGSLRSFVGFSRGRLEYWADGQWKEGTADRQADVKFPGIDGTQATWLLAGPELLSIQRRIPAQLIQATLNMDLGPMLANVTEDVIASTPLGPSEEVRSASRFTHIVEVESADGTISRGYVSGKDIYLITAICGVEAAICMSTSGAPKGAIAPSELMEPEEFLRILGRAGVEWEL